jgi:hypothetical protein
VVGTAIEHILFCVWHKERSENFERSQNEVGIAVLIATLNPPAGCSEVDGRLEVAAGFAEAPGTLPPKMIELLYSTFSFLSELYQT